MTQPFPLRFGMLVALVVLAAGCPSDPMTDAGAGADVPGADVPRVGTDAPSGVDAPTSGTDTGPSTDPYLAARETCIAEINRLRATRSLPPYTRWTGVEMCVDSQARSDEMTGDAHGAWSGGLFPECNGSGQNECLGGGAAGIVSCLGRMWAERDLPGCSGCDACADAYNPDCPNCDFYGSTTGDVCGHYVNMSARYFDEAACGFGDSWAVINFR